MVRLTTEWRTPEEAGGDLGRTLEPLGVEAGMKGTAPIQARPNRGSCDPRRWAYKDLARFPCERGPGDAWQRAPCHPPERLPCEGLALQGEEGWHRKDQGGPEHTWAPMNHTLPSPGLARITLLLIGKAARGARDEGHGELHQARQGAGGLKPWPAAGARVTSKSPHLLTRSLQRRYRTST